MFLTWPTLFAGVAVDPATTSDYTMTEKPPRKTKSSGGGGKKLSAFNRFMQSEMARLKETEPNMPHQERFKQGRYELEACQREVSLYMMIFAAFHRRL
ncbi:hypothetical protein F5141DRAFT_697582 [Pisolithus sp. B1]|nr:hypothetical protein F5141DRAFT_697582 [Pisolithus sp. B1]